MNHLFPVCRCLVPTLAIITVFASGLATPPAHGQAPPSDPTITQPRPSSEEASGGWRLANLNPFRSKEPERGMAELADSPPNRPNWKLPSISRRSEPESGGFKPLQKINDGARGLFTTAKNTLSRPFQRSPSAPKESGWGLFGRRSEPPREVESANDWLKLPRPSPGGN